MPPEYTPLAVDDDSQTPLPAPSLPTPTRRSIVCVILLLILVAVGYQSTNLSSQKSDLDSLPNTDEKNMSGKLNVA
jgi:hypothetical protein